MSTVVSKRYSIGICNATKTPAIIPDTTIQHIMNNGLMCLPNHIVNIPINASSQNNANSVAKATMRYCIEVFTIHT